MLIQSESKAREAASRYTAGRAGSRRYGFSLTQRVQDEIILTRRSGDYAVSRIRTRIDTSDDFASGIQHSNAVLKVKARDSDLMNRSAAVQITEQECGPQESHHVVVLYDFFCIHFSDGNEEVYIFNADEAAAFIQSEYFPETDPTDTTPIQPASKSGLHVRGIPACYTHTFGNDFYVEQSFASLANQTREQWKIRVEGQLCNTGMQLNVTDYDTLRSFIQKELGDWRPQEEE